MTPFWQFAGALVHTLIGLLDDVGDISAAIVVTLAVIKTTIHVVRQCSRRRSGRRAGSTTARAQRHMRATRRRRRRSRHASASVSGYAAPRHCVRGRLVQLPSAPCVGTTRCYIWDGERLAPITLAQAIERLRTE